MAGFSGGALSLAGNAPGIVSATPACVADAEARRLRPDGSAGFALVLSQRLGPALDEISGWSSLIASALPVDRHGDLIFGCRERFSDGNPSSPKTTPSTILGFPDAPKRLYSATMIGCDQPNGIAMLQVDRLISDRRPFFEGGGRSEGQPR